MAVTRRRNESGTGTHEDAAGALAYLTTTFGFVQRLAHPGAAGRMHTELLLAEDGLVMLGQAGEGFKSPARLDPSVLVHLYVDDVDALHERARAAGADVTDLELSPFAQRVE